MSKAMYQPVFFALAILVASATVATGCDSKRVSCQPGESQACTCEDGTTGTQECLATGDGFQVCDCSCLDDCGARECGPVPNGCGTTCGSCNKNFECNELSGMCEASCLDNCGQRQCGPVPNKCGDSCGACTAPALCNPQTGLCDSSCLPDCGARECGPVPNGCGLDCGLCTSPNVCNSLTWTCDAACQNDCGPRQCGPVPNGCGLSCGDCEFGLDCNLANGQCERCLHDCGTRECGLDPVCQTEDCGPCDGFQQCDPATGICQACVPQCQGKCPPSMDGCGSMCPDTCPATGQTCDGASGACTGLCVPKTCTDLGRECSSWPDGCNGLTSCGPCELPSTCNLATGLCEICIPDCVGKCPPSDDGCGQTCLDLCSGTGQTCNGATGLCEGVCTPLTCSDLGMECGDWQDGCGHTLTCPGCDAPELCNTLTGQCEQCTPDFVSCLGRCSPAVDNCGESCLDLCPATGQTCDENTGTCQGTCVPLTCEITQLECGTWPDGCDGEFSCPPCGDQQTCDMTTGQCQGSGNCCPGQFGHISVAGTLLSAPDAQPVQAGVAILGAIDAVLNPNPVHQNEAVSNQNGSFTIGCTDVSSEALALVLLTDDANFDGNQGTYFPTMNYAADFSSAGNKTCLDGVVAFSVQVLTVQMLQLMEPAFQGALADGFLLIAVTDSQGSPVANAVIVDEQSIPLANVFYPDPTLIDLHSATATTAAGLALIPGPVEVTIVQLEHPTLAFSTMTIATTAMPSCGVFVFQAQ